MACKMVLRMEMQEIIRRWQAGNSRSHITSRTRLSRDTVSEYIAVVEQLGVSRGGWPRSREQLSRLAGIGRSGQHQTAASTEERMAPWADKIYQWLTGDWLQLTRVLELLLGCGCQVSYKSLRRFVQKRNWWQRNPATIHMEDTAPGEVAELDFGRLTLTRAAAAPCGR